MGSASGTLFGSRGRDCENQARGWSPMKRDDDAELQRTQSR